MPINNGSGRPFNTTYPLGKFMREDRLSVNKVAADTNISHRKLSDYLANRVPYLAHHLATLAEYFQCEMDDLIPDIPPQRANSKIGAYG